MVCPPGTIDCDGECRDLSNDPEFCGTCQEVACDDSQWCADGLCECRPELAECNGDCVDLDSDPNNCGDCEVDCGVDIETDPLNCGGCGDSCAVDQICAGGECWDYEPAVGCDSCGACDVCGQESCCELQGYGVSCVDIDIGCP
jgi:hypothetical protein